MCHNHIKPRNEESQVLNASLNMESVLNLWGGGEEHYSLASVEAEVPSHFLVIRLIVLWSVAGIGGSETV